MSARQAFVPRPSSCVSPSDTTDTRSKDGDKAMFGNGNSKARSITAFLGQKRGGTDTAPKGAGLGRANTSRNRRSFEGILRPELTPMSIIPYPTAQLGAGMKQSGAGQTPRKTAGSGAFARPMTPVSVPRGFKKGFGVLTENREDEVTSNVDVHGSGIMFRGPEGDADVRIGAGTGIGGYMRVFGESGGGGNAGGLQSSLECDMAAPVPGYALGGLRTNQEDEGCEIDGIFARSSRPLGEMAEEEVGMENNNNSQRSLGGTKRGMHREDIEESGRYTDDGHQTEGSAKRMRQMRHDPDGYFPISSPHIPSTPGPPTSSVDMLGPSLIVAPMFENMEEFVSLDEIEADWKRWKGCTTEEWLKGTDGEFFEFCSDETHALCRTRTGLHRHIEHGAQYQPNVSPDRIRCPCP
ncbi:hypothetical protein JVT61DRAFT_7971 [Boletus reticuloceps]|uniref:Uncharacterized protein n=1 Tax=Boletus reticuloceps TaxID=495285 RepID=A0A8I2YIZ8_9AGAM|nr:hypothetical protein JVT61DRAFT_7971 [Boletus reticuloceps]